MNSIRSLSIVLVSLLLAAAGVAHAQGVGSSGDIRGTVTDPSGSTIPKATVTVRDRETGLEGTVLTGATGQFRVTELPPASYDVTAELSGFTSETHKEVAVALGQTVTSDFRLSLSQVAVHVDVNNGVRQIANTLVSVLGVSGSPALNSAAIFKTLFSRGKILCGTPPSGAEACITPADLEQFGLTVSNSGPYPPGTVLFFSQPNYRSGVAKHWGAAQS